MDDKKLRAIRGRTLSRNSAYASVDRRALLDYVDELSPYKEACDRVLKALDAVEQQEDNIRISLVRTLLMGEEV